MDLRQKIGDAIVDGIVNPACSTMQATFQDLFVILCGDGKHEVALADGTTENVH
jgi:hypothetical protein